MTAKILDGNAISAQILDELREEVEKMGAEHGVRPGLVTILAGENPASKSYVRRKVKTAESLGLYEVQVNLPEDISEEELLETIEKYNRDDRVHGILVQLPLPRGLDEKRILNAISPEKDVDGFHPLNMGKLLAGEDESGFVPCTPAGIREMLIRGGVALDGAEVVVVGRSNIVGKPIAALLSRKDANATVTLAHSHTRDLPDHCRRADVLIVATGVPGLIRAEWIRPGACVIDVGVNRIGVNEKTGKAILAGDVDFEAASKVAGLITPVPGGVGPMTIAMLMKNTVQSAKRKLGIKQD